MRTISRCRARCLEQPSIRCRDIPWPRVNPLARAISKMARCSVDRRLTARRVAATHGLIDILINSGELNRSIHRGELGTVSCCEAMQQEIKPRDVVVLDRHSGAGMTVRKGEPWAHTS